MQFHQTRSKPAENIKRFKVRTKVFEIFFFFFYCNGQLWVISWEDSLTNSMLITGFVQFRPEGHWEPRNKVGSLSLTECLVGFETSAFQLQLQCFNPLGHFPLGSYFICCTKEGFKLNGGIRSIESAKNLKSNSWLY